MADFPRMTANEKLVWAAAFAASVAGRDKNAVLSAGRRACLVVRDLRGVDYWDEANAATVFDEAVNMLAQMREPDVASSAKDGA